MLSPVMPGTNSHNRNDTEMGGGGVPSNCLLFCGVYIKSETGTEKKGRGEGKGGEGDKDVSKISIAVCSCNYYT
jgi:hypothetical protein